MSALDTALVLLKAGLRPVPIKPGSKAPIGEGWGEKQHTAESLKCTFAATRQAGVGLLLGPDGGVIDIDCDGPDAEASLLKLFDGGAPATLGWASARGRHLLFQYDPRIEAVGKSVVKLPGLEIRIGADGKQSQSNVPPTKGTDDKPRLWNERREIAKLPEGFFDRLASLNKSQRAGAERAATTTTTRPASGGPGPFVATASDGPSPLGRCKSYLLSAGFPRSVQGQRGSDALFRAACEAVSGFGLTRGEALEVLREFNIAKCDPPWSDREIEHKLDDAIKNNPVPSLKRLNAPPVGASRQSPDAPADEDDSPIDPPAWPAPMDEAAFQGVAGDVVRAIEPCSESDVNAVLLQFLIAYGNAIGRNAHFIIEETHHYANEFCVLVGETSAGRKGTSWAQSRRFVAEADPDWAGKRILSGLSSGEGLIFCVRDAPGGTPAPGGGLSAVAGDAGVDDKRLMIVESEFGGALRAMSREGNRLSAILRQSWDGDVLSSMTKNTPYRATGAHVSIIGHITAEELEELLTACDVANGLANRALWCCCKRSKELPHGARLPDDLAGELATRTADAVAFGKSAGRIAWSSEAMASWEPAYGRLTAARHGAFGKATSRAAPHVKRLATIYALLGRSGTVQVEHLRAALAVWDYCERSAAFIFGTGTGNRDADKALSAIQAARGGMTRTEIRRTVFRDNKPASAVEAILSKLARRGLIVSRIEKTSGRPAQRWHAANVPTSTWYVKDVLDVESPPLNGDGGGTKHVNHVKHVPRKGDGGPLASGVHASIPQSDPSADRPNEPRHIKHVGAAPETGEI